MKENAFNNLEKQFEGDTSREMRQNLLNTLGSVRLLGNVADVYLSRMVETVVTMTGGGRGPKDLYDGRTGSSEKPKHTGYPNQ